MKMNIAKSIVLAGGVLLAASGAVAQDESARSLDELLGFVKQGQTSEAKENSAREARFRAAKADQAKMLQEAKDERTRQERRSAQLEKQFEDNEKRLAAAQNVFVTRWVHCKNCLVTLLQLQVMLVQTLKVH